MKAFLDMDGVLCDFVSAACSFHGRENPYLDYNIAAHGEWSLEKLLNIEPERFWRPLGYHFWRNLHWTPDGKKILDIVESIFGRENICLLSSPCDTTGCVQGKLDWIAEQMPDYRRRFLIGPPKEFAAGPNRVLIDDSDLNFQKFTDAGGKAFLVPRPWNRHHSYSWLGGSILAASLRSALAKIKSESGS